MLEYGASNSAFYCVLQFPVREKNALHRFLDQSVAFYTSIGVVPSTMPLEIA